MSRAFQWPTTRLGEATSFVGSGATPRGGKEAYKDTGIALIRSLNVYDLAFEFDGLARIDQAQAHELRKVEVEPEDVLLNITGASVARCCAVPESVLPARVNQHVAIVRADNERLDPRFLVYALVSDYYKSQLLGLASAGATREALTKRKIEDFEISLPPVEAQRRIASLLRAFDDLIDNNRRRIEILEEMARLIYREWFVHFRFPGHDEVELVDSDLGLIPEGWEAVPLSDLVTTQYGYTESAQDEPVGPRYLRGMDMNKSSFIDWSTVPYCPISDSDRKKFKVDVGDVFVIRMADPGKIGICEREVDAVYASYLVRLKPVDGRVLPYYQFFTLSDDRYQAWVTGASTGATRKSVSAKVMTEPLILLPPAGVQERFVDTVGPIRALLTNLLKQNGVLATTRDLLLPRLISGELDVLDLDLDLEPVA
jgi:type I restriction enzyme, S subunit